MKENEKKQNKSALQNAPKKEIRQEKRAKEAAAEAIIDSSDEDENQHQSANAVSKAAAEKVLAEKFLQRPRSDRQENATNTDSSIDGKANTTGDTEVHVFDDSDVGSTPEKTRKNVSKQSPNIKQDCCNSCLVEMSSLKDWIANINDDLAVIKKKLRKLRKNQPTAAAEHLEVLPSNELENECRALINNSTSLFNSVSILMRRLFTVEEIMAHSVSGKAPNSKTVAKPKFDNVKLELLKSLALEIHKEANTSQITAKIQAVQKAVRRENSTL